MANSRFRCAGCRDFKPSIDRRRVGTVGVCSDECARTVLAKRPLGRGEGKHLGRQVAGTGEASGRSPRGNPGSEIPTAVREIVGERDRSSCRFCGRNRAGHLHHIRYRSEGVDHSEHNLISLCLICHYTVHGDKRMWKPVLLGVIWRQYVHGEALTALAFVRRYGRKGDR